MVLVTSLLAPHFWSSNDSTLRFTLRGAAPVCRRIAVRRPHQRLRRQGDARVSAPGGRGGAARCLPGLDADRPWRVRRERVRTVPPAAHGGLYGASVHQQTGCPPGVGLAGPV